MSVTNHPSTTTVETFETPDDTSNEMYQSLDPNATVEEVEQQLNPLCKWFGKINFFLIKITNYIQTNGSFYHHI